MFTCPIPAKYVLENGQRIYNHVICDAKYRVPWIKD